MDNELKILTQKIIDYANNDKEYGWLEFEFENVKFKFPKRALIWYVFQHTSMVKKHLPPYDAISPIGVKMYGDSRYHTDVMLGAGIPLDSYHDVRTDEGLLFNQAQHVAKMKIEKEFSKIFSFDFTILANGLPSEVKGFRAMVYEGVKKLEKNTISNVHILCQKGKTDFSDFYPELKAICIPHAGIEFDLVAKKADLIITEVGGKLSHLSTVSRESGKILIRVDDAMNKFPTFSKLNLCLEKMTITPSIII